MLGTRNTIYARTASKTKTNTTPKPKLEAVDINYAKPKPRRTLEQSFQRVEAYAKINATYNPGKKPDALEVTSILNSSAPTGGWDDATYLKAYVAFNETWDETKRGVISAEKDRSTRDQSVMQPKVGDSVEFKFNTPGLLPLRGELAFKNDQTATIRFQAGFLKGKTTTVFLDRGELRAVGQEQSREVPEKTVERSHIQTKNRNRGKDRGIGL